MDTVAYRRMKSRASVAETALRAVQQKLSSAQIDRRELATLRAQLADAEQAVIEADHLRVQLQQSRDELAGAEAHAHVLTEQLEQTRDEVADTARLACAEIIHLAQQLADQTAAVERLGIESRGLDAMHSVVLERAEKAEARVAELEGQLATLADRQDLVRRLQRERDARLAAEKESARLRAELRRPASSGRPTYVLGPAPAEGVQS